MTAGAIDGRARSSRVAVSGPARHRIELQLDVFGCPHDRGALKSDPRQRFKSSRVGRHEIGQVEENRPRRRACEQQIRDLSFTESTGKPEHTPVAFLCYADPALHDSAEVARRRPLSIDDFESGRALLLAFQGKAADPTSDRSQYSVSCCRTIGDRRRFPSRIGDDRSLVTIAKRNRPSVL